MLLNFLRLLGSYVPKAPRLPGAYAPKSPLLLRLLCSERNFLKILFLMYFHKGLSLRKILRTILKDKYLRKTNLKDTS